MEPGGDYASWFDEATHTLTVTQATRLEEIVWHADEAAYGPYPFQLAVFVEGEAVVTATLTAPEYGVFALPQAGGTVAGLAGKVAVTVPEGALPEAIELRIQPAPQTALPYALSGHPFRLTAVGQTSGAEITQFEKALTVQVAYDEADLFGHESGLVLFYFDEAGGTWRALPSWVDMEHNLLYGYTTHFSYFDLDVQTWEMAHVPNLDAFQVSSFTGAATYSFPIWTPPGPGGLQPSVSINYNSQVVDGATARTQAGIAGMGWSLSAGGAIQRNMNGTNDDLSDDTFSFVAGGVSSALLPVADLGNKIEFRTTDESFWRIYGYKLGTDDFNKWEAWDKTGTKYVFGDTVETRAAFPRYTGASTGCFDGYRHWYWGLRTTTNLFNRSLTYIYFKETTSVNLECDNGPAQTAEVAIYLSQIRYPNEKYRVVFAYNARQD